MRPLNSSVRYFLVQRLRISNKKATELICSGQVLVNDQPASVHQKIQPEDSIIVGNEEIRAGKRFTYWKYYKPRSVETTLNREIPDNLHTVLYLPPGLFPIGRLDKESEGLLLFSDNGRIFNKTLMTERHEKEYLVEVDRNLEHEHIRRLSSGIEIMGYTTRPCSVEKIGDKSFRIILTEGKNRQIRRMCYKLNLEVTRLTRVRIMHIGLDGLFPGLQTSLSEHEQARLLQTLKL